MAKLSRDYTYYSPSTQIAQAEQDLTDAQLKIQDLEALNQQLLTQIKGSGKDAAKKETTPGNQMVAIDQIDRDPDQCRRWFDPTAQTKLTETIKTVGFRGTIWVRPGTKGRYQLVAGERRLRAAIDAGLTELPVDIMEIDDDTALTLSLLENLQREDLNPVEETEGVLKLLSRRLDRSVDEVISVLYKMKNQHQGSTVGNEAMAPLFFEIDALFRTIGRVSWLSFITTRLPLLTAPPEILEVLRQGGLEYTKAMAISRVKDATVRQALLDESMTLALSLSEIRQRIKRLQPQEDESLKQQFQQLLKKKTPAWQNPKKMQKIQSLLSQLEDLLGDA